MSLNKAESTNNVESGAVALRNMTHYSRLNHTYDYLVEACGLMAQCYQLHSSRSVYW
jgi:hypothetical protein